MVSHPKGHSFQGPTPHFLSESISGAPMRGTKFRWGFSRYVEVLTNLYRVCKYLTQDHLERGPSKKANNEWEGAQIAHTRIATSANSLQ